MTTRRTELVRFEPCLADPFCQAQHVLGRYVVPLQSLTAYYFSYLEDARITPRPMR